MWLTSVRTAGRSSCPYKALKQNLKVKTFVGTNSDALKIQIWAALIALLLLK
ncbi:hypothetical protein DFAR_550005 [Desulfarculales bacterium]